jgi:hypothetical protein
MGYRVMTHLNSIALSPANEHKEGTVPGRPEMTLCYRFNENAWPLTFPAAISCC